MYFKVPLEQLNLFYFDKDGKIINQCHNTTKNTWDK